MIDSLSVAMTANFFKIKSRIAKITIADLFTKLRTASRAPSQYLFRHEREQLEKAKWSAVSFFHDRDPSFFKPPPAGQSERICGYMLLVEHRGHCAVFKSGLELPSVFRTKHLQRVANSRVETAMAHEDAVFEKIRLRNMSLSKQALRSKTLESSDLSNAVGPASSNRYVPQSYALRRNTTYYAATPSTGRISQRLDKAGYKSAIGWACSIIDMLIDESGKTSEFIRTFARPVDLASVAATLSPRSFAVNAAYLAELLFEAKSHRLVRESATGPDEVELLEAESIIRALDVAFPVRAKNSEWIILEGPALTDIGRLKLASGRIALKELKLSVLTGIFIEGASNPGSNNERLPLAKFLNQQDLFTLLFDEAALAYIDGELYRDDLLVNGGGNFLLYLSPQAGLAATTSEKGQFTDNHTAFDSDSVFGVLVNDISRDDDVLVCDDLGDEWADFIGLSVRGGSTIISFYHAKYGTPSLGASQFHVAVSQGIKNLGRLTLPADSMDRKVLTWSRDYTNDGAHTKIARHVKGTPSLLRSDMDDARNAPAAIRRVCIVTPSLSRKHVAKTLQEIQQGIPPEPHFVQMYWLLLSFFSACAEVGAAGVIICQE